MSPPNILWIDTPGTALQVRMKSLAVRFGDGRERHFPRGKHALRTIILHASGASVTIEAARWAVDEGVTVLIMHRAGEALAFLTNHPLADCSGPALELRRAQFSADPVKVARALVRAKIDASRTEGVLSDEDTGFGARKLLKAETVDDIMLIEAAVAGIYWRHWYGFELSFSGKAPPEWKRYGTRTRKVSDGMTSARNAADPGNAILNYAYAVVLGNLTRALIALGLDPAFGFLHADKPGRLSLPYDVIEVLRPKIDRCMFQWIASRTFERKEFIELPNGPILLTPGLARQVALRILEKVPPRECELPVKWLASIIKISGGAVTRVQR